MFKYFNDSINKIVTINLIEKNKYSSKFNIVLEELNYEEDILEVVEDKEIFVSLAFKEKSYVIKDRGSKKKLILNTNNLKGLPNIPKKVSSFTDLIEIDDKICDYLFSEEMSILFKTINSILADNERTGLATNLTILDSAACIENFVKMLPEYSTNKRLMIESLFSRSFTIMSASARKKISILNTQNLFKSLTFSKGQQKKLMEILNLEQSNSNKYKSNYYSLYYQIILNILFNLISNTTNSKYIELTTEEFVNRFSNEILLMKNLIDNSNTYDSQEYLNYGLSYSSSEHLITRNLNVKIIEAINREISISPKNLIQKIFLKNIDDVEMDINENKNTLMLLNDYISMREQLSELSLRNNRVRPMLSVFPEFPYGNENIEKIHDELASVISEYLNDTKDYDDYETELYQITSFSKIVNSLFSYNSKFFDIKVEPMTNLSDLNQNAKIMHNCIFSYKKNVYSFSQILMKFSKLENNLDIPIVNFNIVMDNKDGFLISSCLLDRNISIESTLDTIEILSKKNIDKIQYILSIFEYSKITSLEIFHSDGILTKLKEKCEMVDREYPNSYSLTSKYSKIEAMVPNKGMKELISTLVSFYKEINSDISYKYLDNNNSFESYKKNIVPILIEIENKYYEKIVQIKNENNLTQNNNENSNIRKTIFRGKNNKQKNVLNLDELITRNLN